MDDTVRSFNKLHQPSVTPGGLPNHWVFGTRHAVLNPPGNLVHCSPLEQKAAAIIALLLKLIIKGYESPGGRQPSDPEPFAPGSWSTDDSELAAAIAKGLKQHGVLEDPQSPSVCSAEERDLLDEVRSRVTQSMMSMMGRSLTEAAAASIMPGDKSKCHGCGLDEKSFSQNLMKCSACSKAFYHSPTCQRKHWKQHKPTCLANRSSSSPPSASSSTTAHSNMSAHTYYHTVAHKAPEMQALLRALKLDSASPEGLAKDPLRLIAFQVVHG